MIVTEEKPLEEILSFIEPYKNILVLGCDGCTQPPRSLKEADIYAELIKIAGKLKNKGYEVKTFTVSRQCDNNILKQNLTDRLEGMDVILSMACGIGPQTIVETFPEAVVYPAQNTVFMGSENMEEATLYEKCKACGYCVLHLTGGICPITRCSKNIMNGPCGGTTADGKCEVHKDTDCAWYLIYNRLKELGQMSTFDDLQPVRDWRPGGHGGPRRSVRIELTQPPESEPEPDAEPEKGGDQK
jgi:hypothetical protein